MSKKKVLLRCVFINRDTNGEGVLKVGTTLIRVSTVVGILYLFEKRENKENEMVIMNVAEQWLVYATDERASKITGSEKKFKTEEEALDNFITRLRALNVLKN